MSLVVKKRDLSDPAQLQALIVEHLDDLEGGLALLDSRLLLGQVAIDAVAVDADGALVLITLGLVADEEMLLKAVDAYSWCLEYPEVIRRLYPNLPSSAAHPPRVMFIVERMPDAFHRKIKQLGFAEVDCIEFRPLDVDGTPAVYFDSLARLRRSPAATPEPNGTASPVSASGRSTSLKLQKLIATDRAVADREPAPSPVVRIVRRAPAREEPTPEVKAPRTERIVAPADAGRRAAPTVDKPAARVRPPEASVDAAVFASFTEAVAGVATLPEAMVEPFVTVEAPTSNRDVDIQDILDPRRPAPTTVVVAPPVAAAEASVAEPLAVCEPPAVVAAPAEPAIVVAPISIPEPPPSVVVLSEPELVIPEPEPEVVIPLPKPELLSQVPEPELVIHVPEPELAIHAPEPMSADAVPTPSGSQEPDTPLASLDVPEVDVVAASLMATEPDVMPPTASSVEPELLVAPVLALETDTEREPQPLAARLPEAPVADEFPNAQPVTQELEPVTRAITSEPEPVLAAPSAEPVQSVKPVEPIAPVVRPAPSVFSRRPPEPAAAKAERKVAFAGMSSDRLTQVGGPPQVEPSVSTESPSVEESTRATIGELVAATDKSTAFAKPSGAFANRPRTIAPTPSDGPPIMAGPRLGAGASKGNGTPPAVAERPAAAEGQAPAAGAQGIEGSKFPNDGVLTRQWMEFLNQMAAGR
ncbi:MAG TPA: hypothetical protein VFQ62_06405 [Methylomirabilota bacterium]|nr:hypothetical protein [Methylomirabilota bacterium]